MSSNADGAERGFAYNMRNLLEDGPKTTIEFRQHESTIDAVAVAAWVSLACALVETSHSMAFESLVSLSCQRIGNEAYTVLDLLNALGLVNLADYYGQRTLHEHPQPNGPATYVGQAWVPGPEAYVRKIDDNADSSSDLSDIEEPEGIKKMLLAAKEARRQSEETQSRSGNDPMDVDSEPVLPDTSGDARLALSLANGLRPRTRNFRN